MRAGMLLTQQLSKHPYSLLERRLSYFTLSAKWIKSSLAVYDVEFDAAIECVPRIVSRSPNEIFPRALATGDGPIAQGRRFGFQSFLDVFRASERQALVERFRTSAAGVPDDL